MRKILKNLLVTFFALVPFTWILFGVVGTGLLFGMENTMTGGASFTLTIPIFLYILFSHPFICLGAIACGVTSYLIRKYM